MSVQRCPQCGFVIKSQSRSHLDPHEQEIIRMAKEGMVARDIARHLMRNGVKAPSYRR